MTVSISDHIDVPIERVWALVADFGGLMRWHPQVIRCEVTGNDEGASRTVHFRDWWAVERLTRLDPGEHVVEYVVTDCSRPQNVGAKGTITLTATDPQQTRIDWVAGLDAGHEDAAAVNAALEAYYPTRIGHLKAALGLTG
jgi:uncharacterized protein YndB with AHSA1/START domain